MKTDSWSIVMLTMNSKARSIASICSVRRAIGNYHGDVEFIVVDNGSKDGLSEWLIEQPDLIAVINGRNLGVPKARNVGVDVSSGDRILFLDNDVDLKPHALRAFDFKLKRSDVGEVGDAGSVFVPEWAERGDFSHDITDELFPGTNFIVGYCMGMPRHVLDDVGPFDEDYPLFYWEDIDYGIRIRQAGYSLAIVADTCYHYGRTSVHTENLPEAVDVVEEAGRMRTVEKHGGTCPVWVLATGTGDIDELRTSLMDWRENVVIHAVSSDFATPSDPPWTIFLPQEMYPRASYHRICSATAGVWDIGKPRVPKRIDEIHRLNDPLTRRMC